MARKIKIDNANLKRLAQRERMVNVGNRPQRKYILIVCEGTKTEPNYFEAIKAKLPRGVMETIDIQGLGKNTLTIIEDGIKLREKALKEKYRIYDEVWAVFDKDSFPDRNFNNAINRAESQGIDCAWTNEAFELWYLLHFQYVDVGMSRENYKPFIERELTKKMGKPFSYKKNAVDMYSILQVYGNETQAIEWAKSLEQLYDNKEFATHNPCTKVHILVSKLKNLV
jgi:RloB-like protein